jgi:hypothetical protein
VIAVFADQIRLACSGGIPPKATKDARMTPLCVTATIGRPR